MDFLSRGNQTHDSQGKLYTVEGHMMPYAAYPDIHTYNEYNSTKKMTFIYSLNLYIIYITV